MYGVLHWILVVTYGVLPVAVLGWSIYRARQLGRGEPLVGFLITCLSGVILGTAVVLLYALVFRENVRPGVVVRNWYFLIGLLCLMGVLRRGVREGMWRLLR